MLGAEYECKDCGRAFRVDEDEKREPRCPSCEGSNVTRRQAGPLPPWLLRKRQAGPT
jgi:DNA-directed RNA polymerase subunit RPC12/RpoP